MGGSYQRMTQNWTRKAAENLDPLSSVLKLIGILVSINFFIYKEFRMRGWCRSQRQGRKPYGSKFKAEKTLGFKKHLQKYFYI
jgi:hypothetical protein